MEDWRDAVLEVLQYISETETAERLGISQGELRYCILYKKNKGIMDKVFELRLLLRGTLQDQNNKGNVEFNKRVWEPNDDMVLQQISHAHVEKIEMTKEAGYMLSAEEYFKEKYFRGLEEENNNLRRYNRHLEEDLTSALKTIKKLKKKIKKIERSI